MSGVYIVIQERQNGACMVISAHEKRDDAYRAAALLREEHGTSRGQFKVEWLELQ